MAWDMEIGDLVRHKLSGKYYIIVELKSDDAEYYEDHFYTTSHSIGTVLLREVDGKKYVRRSRSKLVPTTKLEKLIYG